MHLLFARLGDIFYVFVGSGGSVVEPFVVRLLARVLSRPCPSM